MVISLNLFLLPLLILALFNLFTERSARALAIAIGVWALALLLG